MIEILFARVDDIVSIPAGMGIGDLLVADSTTSLTNLPPGTSGFVLTSNGPGVAPSYQSNSGVPGGNDTEIQFNNAGAFGGIASITWNGSNLRFNTAPLPLTNDAVALGSATLGWSDAFFASGAVLNFNNGNYTITHSSDLLTFSDPILLSGGATGAAPTPRLLLGGYFDNDGVVSISHITMYDDGGGNQYGFGMAAGKMTYIAASGAGHFWYTAANLATGAYMFAVNGSGSFSTTLHAPSASDGATLGSATLMWSDLFLASGGVINFNNGDITITHSANTLTFNGASSGYVFGDPIVVGSTTLYTSGVISITASNAGIELGSPTASNTPFIDFHTSNNANDWDVRLLASGGALGDGLGLLTISAAAGVVFSGPAFPLVDDGVALGSTANKWSDLFLASGGVIDFASGGVTITHNASDYLAFQGATAGYLFDGTLRLITNDTGALGTATLSWSDLFLAAGGVVNWNNGEAAIVHSTNAITFSGASAGWYFQSQVSPAVSDGAALGSTTSMWSDLFLASGGVINWNNGDVQITHAANALGFSGASGGYSFDMTIYPAANDGGALGGTGNQWSDLYIASGGVINFDNGDVTITHAANFLSFAGASSGYVFDAQVSPASDDGGALGNATANRWSDLFLASGAVINFNNGDVTITHGANLLAIAGGNVGIGTESNPQADLVVSANATTGLASPTGTMLHLIEANATGALLVMDAFGAAGGVAMVGRSAGGTAASQTATQSGNALLSFGGRGHDGTSFVTSNKALILFAAAENWSGSAQGTYFEFYTTQSTTTTRTAQVRIPDDGGIAVKDGITAPGTTSGWAKIYVDSADGDLKVKFGDGTVKTLATDT